MKTVHFKLLNYAISNINDCVLVKYIIPQFFGKQK